jgi:glutaredoxin-related protein
MEPMKILINAIIPVISLGSLALSILAICRETQYTKFNYVTKTLTDFSNNPNLTQMFYKLEYNEFKYDREIFLESKKEKELDPLLRHFSVLALAWEKGQVNIKDIRPVEYYIRRIVENNEVKEYIKDHEDWLKKEGTLEHPFLSLRNLSNALKKKAN